jgi:hypothetical protein
MALQRSGVRSPSAPPFFHMRLKTLPFFQDGVAFPFERFKWIKTSQLFYLRPTPLSFNVLTHLCRGQMRRPREARKDTP